jgi:hypothetical protein
MVRTLLDSDNNNNIKYDNNDNIESEGDEHYSCGVGGDDGGVVIYYIYQLSDWCQQLVPIAAAEERVVYVARRFWLGAERSLRLMI